MELEQLAQFFAILTVLEPDAEVCKFTAKLAEAGTATAESTDFSVIKEIKNNVSKIKEELDTLDKGKLDRMQGVIAKILD